MATIKRFEDLEIWQLARQLNKFLFALTEKGEFIKDFKFKYQLRDAGGSIMDNIAEGFGRGGNREFSNFLSMSEGSCNEVQSQLYRAMDWKYITEDEFKAGYGSAKLISDKTGALITYLLQSEYKGQKFRNRANDKQQTTNDKP